MASDDPPSSSGTPSPPAWDFRELEERPPARYLSPGARKEKLRQARLAPALAAAASAARSRSAPGVPTSESTGQVSTAPASTSRPAGRARRRPSPPPYAELRAASAFSFLEGASLPEDLVARAAELELPAVALVDRHGVYGAPRFYQAARQTGLAARVGAEVALAGPRPRPDSPADPASDRRGAARLPPGGGVETRPAPEETGPAAGAGAAAPLPLRPLDPRVAAASLLPRLTLLVASRQGYRNLCRLSTAAAAGRPKGEAAATWELVACHAEGLHCLTGGAEGPLARALAEGGVSAARRELERLVWLFPGRLHVELQRHRRPEEEARNQALLELARALRLPVVATNGVRYARAEDKPLADLFTCLRHYTTLDEAGSLLAPQRQRHLKGAAEMAALFPDLPEALEGAFELSQRLDFTLADLGYRFPDYPLPAGETPASFLRQIAWNGARARFRPLTARHQAQIEKELALIERLDLAGYFLIVWDVVEYCRREGIMAQGRGSAANSAVCYALGITAVDPVKMELLFERFLSEERGEWPDIDLDLPSGDPREKVIQHVYQRYGEHGAAMTANVITYRDRSAAREVAKVLGYSPEQVDRLAKRLATWGVDLRRGDSRQLDAELAEAGFDPAEPRMRLFADLWRRLQGLPRHLGQHSGGMVLAAGRLDEVVPLEPAAMPGRVVVQWDKDDCADLGLIKVDLLGLGMLNVLEEAVPLVRAKEGVHLDLAHLPPDDPEVFRMLRAADTVGVFQVESRAQMASLPRNAPERFYDLVVQVAIIRPGPIVGGMVHPYFERRQGREEVTYPHPCLEPVLARTLGVPLFQEQILRMAMVTAGFSGGEAEELRRAMGFKRSAERMEAIEARLRAGMAARGIVGEVQDAIVQSITSFALYGFPESHAASFALIAYASAWLKAHHPTAFLIALLNAWPMGFYHPATLIRDAQHHGVEVRPIDVNHSAWSCRWEEAALRPPTVGAELASARVQRPPTVGAELASARSNQGENAPGAPLPGAGKLPPYDPMPIPGGRASRSAEAGGSPAGACRLGLRFVRGLRHKTGQAIEAEAARRPFGSAEDLARRCRLREDELTRLAHLGALGSLGLTRRQALWQVARAARPAGPLFAEDGGPQALEPSAPLPEMTPFEETLADFAGAELTVGAHPVSYLRPQLRKWGVVSAAEAGSLPNRQTLRIAGSVIVRQRPGTARGLLFLTLEDETGCIQAAVMPDRLAEHRRLLAGSPGLVIEGVLQKRDGTVTVRGERFWPLSLARVPSHDFR
jgi:error-prone DNA polymerase